MSNKEWIFSGVGIAVVSALFAIIKTKIPKNSERNLNVSGDKIIIGDRNKVQITNISKEKQKSDIKIVDISLDEDKEFTVDIKLRNIGDQVAYIKEISFNILDYYNMLDPQKTLYQLIKPSHTYDVILGKEKQQVFKVSQRIGANEVDRFQVKLASSIAEARMSTIYYLTLSIIYDEDNKVEQSEKYLWAVPSVREYAGYFISQMDMEIAKKNYLELKKMDGYDAIKSEHFLGILRSYEENKSDFLT